MGEHEVNKQLDDRQLRAFMKALLDDVNALEHMLDTDCFETGVRRIGAEQEMFLVDEDMRPAPVVMEVLERANDPRLTTELARFNLEANASPRDLGGKCLSEMEQEVSQLVAMAQRAAAEVDAQVVLSGILPTLQQSDLSLDNMTPDPRYLALNRAMMDLRGGDIRIAIQGLDELDVHHDNVMLESCNTSFQVHFQVAPAEFAKLYNVAQAVTAPVMAAAVNSPLLLGHRLWNETRVALFQQSIDARSTAHQSRGLRPRVSFGDAWVEDSVLEIFREDIARFRVVLAAGLEDNPMDVLERGGVPALSALRLHNGTVYRWNRACYGISDKGPHLRIENRVLPAGPTVRDEVANAALYFGLMSAMIESYGEVDRVMAFDDAKNNFFAAAQHGLNAQFRWIGNKTVTAEDLLVEELIPMARDGLVAAGIDASDTETYLSLIEERVRSRRTGAAWVLESLARMEGRGTRDMRERCLTSAMIKNQASDQAGHEWPPCELVEDGWEQAAYRTVGQFMSTDLFTVRPHDLVDLAASVMDWEHIRHVPVEDDDGRLIGVLTHRALLRLIARGRRNEEPVAVRDLMKVDPVTVQRDTPTLAAMRLMRNQGLGCLPVVEEGKLVGIVTESDLIAVSAKLLEIYLQET